MFLKVYAVAATDKFNAHDYPEIINELIGIKTELKNLPYYGSVEMVISFFKDHSIQRALANENPEVFNLVSRGMLSAHHIETLFASCRSNSTFLSDYENFIAEAITN
jgi:hypothetical protein